MNLNRLIKNNEQSLFLAGYLHKSHNHINEVNAIFKHVNDSNQYIINNYKNQLTIHDLLLINVLNKSHPTYKSACRKYKIDKKNIIKTYKIILTTLYIKHKKIDITNQFISTIQDIIKLDSIYNIYDILWHYIFKDEFKDIMCNYPDLIIL